MKKLYILLVTVVFFGCGKTTVKPSKTLEGQWLFDSYILDGDEALGSSFGSGISYLEAEFDNSSNVTWKYSDIYGTKTEDLTYELKDGQSSITFSSGDFFPNGATFTVEIVDGGGSGDDASYYLHLNGNVVTSIDGKAPTADKEEHQIHMWSGTRL